MVGVCRRRERYHCIIYAKDSLTPIAKISSSYNIPNLTDIGLQNSRSGRGGPIASEIVSQQNSLDNKTKLKERYTPDFSGGFV